MLLKLLWPCRFLIEQRCGPEEGAGSSPAERASARQYGQPRQHHLSRWSEALLYLWPAGGPETCKEMHVLHLQRQGVCVLLSSGHHLDQHTRVRVILQTSSVCLSLLLIQYCCSTVTYCICVKRIGTSALFRYHMFKQTSKKKQFYY